MNRITRSTMRRLSPRAMVIGGAALGLVAGTTVYGAVSSAAEPKAPAAVKAPGPAPARFADCAAGAKLEEGVCVVHVVRTVVAPSAASATTGAGAPAAGATPGSTPQPSSPAQPASPAQPGAAASSSPATGGGDDGEGAQSAAPTAAPLSAYDAAVLASKNAAALASKDAATLGANNPTTLAANKAATLAAQKAASLAPVNGG